MSVDAQLFARREQPGARSLVIESAGSAGEDILVLTLVDPNAAELPGWQPGAHIDVALPPYPVRQYSLCGDPADRRRYRIAVLRSQDPGGLSHGLHAYAAEGHPLTITGPRNRFVLDDASAYLFLAGGIGITPILPMIRDAAHRARPWRLKYGARTRARLALADEIDSLPGGRVDVVIDEEDGPMDIETIVRDCPAEVAIYACGPSGMLTAVEEVCRAWRPEHPPSIERFSPALANTVNGTRRGGRRAFDVELRRTGVTLTVPANRTLLSVVRDVLPRTPFSCEEGVCGTCETSVLAGVPEHHDEVLTDAERAEGSSMMICVGRSATPLLVLDL